MSVRRKVLAVLLAEVLPLSSVGVVNAESSLRDINLTSSELMFARNEGLAPAQIEEAKQAAFLMEDLFEAQNSEARERVFVETLGMEDANAVAGQLGLQITELFSDEVITDGTGNRGVGEFLTCMKSEVSDDLKSIFDVNAIAVLIGREKYFEAAVEAVKYLGKQGIKRNVAGLAATLAYYGAKCAFFKD